MSKFWLNEKFLILASIILLLLFLGCVYIFDSWMESWLDNRETVALCSVPGINEEERIALQEQAIYLENFIANFGENDQNPEVSSTIDNFKGDQCGLTLYGGGNGLTLYDAWIGLGITYYRLEQYNKARKSLVTASQYEEDSFVYNLLSENEWAAGRYLSARSYLNKAIELEPDNYLYWEDLIRLEKEHFKADFNELNDLHILALKASQSERAFSGYAYFLEECQKYDQAAEVWRSFLEFDPSYEDHYRPRVEWLESKT